MTQVVVFLAGIAVRAALVGRACYVGGGSRGRGLGVGPIELGLGQESLRFSCRQGHGSLSQRTAASEMLGWWWKAQA